MDLTRSRGFAGLGDIVIAGDEDQVAAELQRYADLGATDALVSRVGNTEERDRTLHLLGELSSGAASAPRSP
jgi:alkanesulfonate monooxygenase SsuD/methylene tetrahydromethanopterin reductase-like flavin-dependent oxidoreductase (luciferase family)